MAGLLYRLPTSQEESNNTINNWVKINFFILFSL